LRSISFVPFRGKNFVSLRQKALDLFRRSNRDFPGVQDVKLITAFIGIFLCLALAGCSGGQANENTTTAQVVNANPDNTSNVVPYTPVNGPNVNGAFNANSNGAVTVSPPMKDAKPLTYSAPDNSEYAVIMDKSGEATETRTFRSDKYLTKVVRTIRGPEDKSIAIYLKSGKVVSVPGDKWPDIRSQPVQFFYDAAGIKYTNAPPADAAIPMAGKTKPPNKQ
jgi:hypothetical protein